MASDLYAMAPSLTLDLNNDGTTCNSGTIITPSHLPPRFRSVCYGSIANPTHLSHSRSELELIDTKPNWVKGDTWVIMVVKLKLGVMWLLEGEGERDMKPVVEVEVVLWWGLVADVVLVMVDERGERDKRRRRESCLVN
ncbi:hypothetical protein HanIR_Chr17g0875471 [Helianthus annuus]|nr:hypothetical protein HanIR_Chr17g0875471 [Helianthus annuus]